MPHPMQDQRFADWLRDHAAIVHHVVHAFAAGDDRNDLRQEILLSLWRAAPAFREGSASSTFVYRVAHNAALLWLRGERKHARHVAAAPEIGWMSEPETARARTDTPARLEQLYAALQTLPPLDRSLLLLSLDGLSYRDIAAVHGLSESNVGARLTRARQHLSRQLNLHVSDSL
jgi:RNA polymerase sigma factor (sigma-70 family)